MKKRITVFDFDGTLTRDDSFLAFPRQILGLRATLRGIIKGLPAILKWKAGLTDSSEAKERLTCCLYKGMDKADLMRRAEGFCPHYREEILGRLRESLERGDEVWIVSASLDLWLESVARRLGVKLLCTGTATDESGRLTGRFSTPNCNGEEKLRRLRRACPDLDSCHLIAYGDRPDSGDAALRAAADEFISD